MYVCFKVRNNPVQYSDYPILRPQCVPPSHGELTAVKIEVD